MLFVTSGKGRRGGEEEGSLRGCNKMLILVPIGLVAIFCLFYIFFFFGQLVGLLVGSSDGWDVINVS